MRNVSGSLLGLVWLPLIAAGCGMEGVAVEGESGLDAESVADSAISQGNANLSGPHYTLNILGKSRQKIADMTGADGHVIFVPLSGSARIYLGPGDFQVIDANGTDGSAKFQLPSPDPANTGSTTYQVYARALGKPGGSAKATTCADEPTTGETFCSVYSTVMVRNTGRSSWSNVSRELLYVYADVNADGVLERLPLFDATLSDYYWQYDNDGLRHAQLRFYPVAASVD